MVINYVMHILSIIDSTLLHISNSIPHYIRDILDIIFYFIAIKAILIGSDFKFLLWAKHGKSYMTWYRNRPTYKEKSKK